MRIEPTTLAYTVRLSVVLLCSRAAQRRSQLIYFNSPLEIKSAEVPSKTIQSKMENMRASDIFYMTHARSVSSWWKSVKNGGAWKWKALTSFFAKEYFTWIPLYFFEIDRARLNNIINHHKLYFIKKISWTNLSLSPFYL